MTIGEKIRTARLEKKMTQSELANGRITRNMLSAIESGKATPSLDTLYYLAERLNLSADYLVSLENDLTFYRKKELMPRIKNALSKKKYNECIAIIEELDEKDDELFYILASCTFELGVSATQFGSLLSASGYLESSLDYCEKTIYDTRRYETVIPLYLSITKNINSPLLEFDIEKYENAMRDSVHFEFFKYMIGDVDFSYESIQYKNHLEAKSKIKERKYDDAIRILREIESKKGTNYNVYVMLGVYTDLDNCYRQLFDFENAHKYATKRITLMENLNT